ncbi:uncharacterized protein FTOL_12201 [Fusarium torulosum]|uniref:Uncharacterized protein n=1 Tax=Fusarium torulosum TaxID=33205 RepID=A0AAE8MJF3_9HYPO|nr:uncharacterized protein FTOL_12201 [Fusarium torulosum]
MARGKKPIKQTLQNKRRIKEETLMSSAIKLEGDELMDDFPLFPGFFDGEKENGIQEEFILDTDTLALKGQVWPGMGKMDLADEVMRRNRNQKKPKCVIDRMKRASERIEPTQVIMTSDLEVKRTKDVYDDTSSPVPGQEDSTPPRKAPKTKHKKPTPLAEVSGNVPRRRITTRGSKPGTGKKIGTKKQQTHQEEPETWPSPDQQKQKQTQDIFRDDINRLGEYSSISEPPHPPTRSDRRFDLRNRYGARNLDFLHSNLVSPTPQSRDLASQHLPAREGTSSLRPESFPPGSFGHVEASYAMKDATIYNASSRLPFVPENYNQFRGLAPEQIRLAADYGFQLRQGEYPGSITGGSTQGTNDSPFIGMPGANPLFSQDRSFLNSYDQGASNTTFSPLSFSPINQQQELSHNNHDAKSESQMCEEIENNGLDDHELGLDGSWSLHATNNDLDFPHGLPMDESQI